MKYSLAFVFSIFLLPAAYAQPVNEALFKRAEKVPLGKARNIDVLLNYLTKTASNDMEKVEVISYWMALHIAYDKDGFNSRKSDTDWEAVLNDKVAVCSGYANLFKEFCDRLGINSEVIPGFSNTKNVITNLPDHAWNVVEIDGEYLLTDITWAAGSATYSGNKIKKFNKTFNAQWLFVAPSEFITTHYPLHKRWQLLDHPKSFEWFKNNGLEEESHERFDFNESIRNYFAMDMYDQQIERVKNEVSVSGDTSRLARRYLALVSDQIKDPDQRDRVLEWMDIIADLLPELDPKTQKEYSDYYLNFAKYLRIPPKL